MTNKKLLSLLAAVVLIVGAIIYLDSGKAKPVLTTAAPSVQIVSVATTSPAQKAEGRIEAKVRKYEMAKEIVNPSGFVNTGGKPIAISDYVGKKVILLDIMTYSCINCIRTFPYIADWYKKYEDKGLIVIGIHTPEFEFEKNIDNVAEAMKKYGITFPVVLDNDYGTWSAYKNLYWPRKYLIDIDGFIRYDHIGEGGYAETEEAIQELLKERAAVLGESVSVNMPVTNGAVERGAINQSPETYIGSARNERLANGEPGRTGTKNFIKPRTLSESSLYLEGLWDVEPQFGENMEAGARIIYPFAARKVYLVMSADAPLDVEVTLDGKPLGDQRGDDVKSVNGKDVVKVSESRLYNLYSGKEFGSGVIEIKPLSKGLKAFAFTFGS